MSQTIPKNQMEAMNSDPKQRQKSNKTMREKMSTKAFWLLLPTLILLFIVIVYPIISAIVMSLQSGPQIADGKYYEDNSHFVGLQNYVDWLFQQINGQPAAPGTNQDKFWEAFGNTFALTIVSVAFETVLGYWMASVMNRNFKGRGLLRASVLIPWAIPTAITAKLWFFMFMSGGIINAVITDIFMGEAIQWTQGGAPSFWAVVIADVWKTTPFMALLILAGMQMIPEDVYEAAKMDGTSAWQRFTRITLPLLRPALVVAILFRTLDALRMYDLPYILANKDSTKTLSILVVDEIPMSDNSASALSTITFVIIFIVAFIFIRGFGANVVEGAETGEKSARGKKNRNAKEREGVES